MSINKISLLFIYLDHAGNFEKASKETTDAFGIGYDYGSVMHYSANAFSRNGQPTIVPKVSNTISRNYQGPLNFLTLNDVASRDLVNIRMVC